MATSSTPKARIAIRPATPDDVAAIVEVHYAAFGRGIMNRLLYPGGPSEDARTKFGRSLFPPASTPGPDGAAAPNPAILMVAEMVSPPSEAGAAGRTEVVAFAKWQVFRTARPEAEWDVDRPMTAEIMGEGADLDVSEQFLGGLNRMRRKWVRGDPAMFLSILACRPSRGRLGAASALLQWGVELADQEALNTWCESSPLGYGLYRRFGFEDLDVQDLPVTLKWNAVWLEGDNWGEKSAVALAGPLPEGVFRTVMMKRAPRCETPR